MLVSPTNVAAVQRRSAPLGRGGVAHLVVDDEVDAASHSEVREVGERQRLGHDALAWEGAITMDLRRAAEQRFNRGKTVVQTSELF